MKVAAKSFIAGTFVNAVLMQFTKQEAGLFLAA